MGLSLSIKILGELGPEDKSVYFHSKTFYYEIILAYEEIWDESNYLKLNDFLTIEEIEIFQPIYADLIFNDDGNYVDYINDRSINPLIFKNVINKLYNYLKINNSELPLVHWIEAQDKYGNNIDSWSTSFSFKDNNIDYYLYGDTQNYEKRNTYREYVQVIINNSIKYTEWIKVESNYILVSNRKINIKSENKFQQYQKYLEEIIDLCNEALYRNKNILWTVDN